MIFVFWQQCCWRLCSAERWRGVRWECLIVFEDSIAFFFMQSFIMNWFIPFWTLNSHSDSTKFLHLHPTIVLICQRFPHPSYLKYTFIPPIYFCTHLYSVQLPWTQRHSFSLTRLNKPLPSCVKPKNDHCLSGDLVRAKNVSLCRMYRLDKIVRVVAIMLLLWFGYHSKIMMQSILSDIFTSSVFDWCFQIRPALHSSTLRTDLLETWEFYTIDVSI
jgi:hypothetical protein